MKAKPTPAGINKDAAALLAAIGQSTTIERARADGYRTITELADIAGISRPRYGEGIAAHPENFDTVNIGSRRLYRLKRK